MNYEKYAQVEGHPNLLRDRSTNAIINTDLVKSQQYISAKKVKEKEKEKISSIESDLSELKLAIQEIKNVLRELHGS